MTVSIRDRPLPETWASTVVPTKPAAADRESTLFFIAETDLKHLNDKNAFTNGLHSKKLDICHVYNMQYFNRHDLKQPLLKKRKRG